MDERDKPDTPKETSPPDEPASPERGEPEDAEVEAGAEAESQVFPLFFVGDDEEEGDEDDGDEEESDERIFLDAVRRAAGWRVSPRQLEAAVEAVVDAGEEPTPERVALVAAAARGPRSKRQRRNADLWRLLGAQLAVRGASSYPEAQLAFIGQARAAAGTSLSDSLLLQVAIEVAANDGPLEARFVGAVAGWLVERAGGDLSEEDIVDEVPEAIPAVTDLLAEAEAEHEGEHELEPKQEGAAPIPRHPMRPRGGQTGRDWRRSTQPRWADQPRVRRRRRAKPAGRSRPPKKPKRG